jgi:hypothetical protein
MSDIINHSIKEGRRDYTLPRRSRPVDQYTLDMEYVNSYPSMKDAQDETGVDASGISKVCRGILKQAKGFLWYFSEQESS